MHECFQYSVFSVRCFTQELSTTGNSFSGKKKSFTYNLTPSKHVYFKHRLLFIYFTLGCYFEKAVNVCQCLPETKNKEQDQLFFLLNHKHVLHFIKLIYEKMRNTKK